MDDKKTKQGLPGIEVTDPESGFKATIPIGWNGQKSQGIFVLRNPAVNGVIIVTFQAAWTKEQMATEIRKDLRDPTIALSPAGQVIELEQGILSMNYKGTINGTPAVAIGFCRYFEGTGVVIVAALALREQYNKQLEEAGASISKSLAFTQQAATPDELKMFFAGTWVRFSANAQSRFVLNPDGSYFDDYESSYSGQLRNATYGIETGYWGVAGQNKSKGRWIAKGTKQRGVFVIIKDNGSQETYNYNVHVENGKIYWNEYYIGGQLYSKQG